MKVTSVKITIQQPKDRNQDNDKVWFKGWAKIIFDDVLLVTGIRFYEKKGKSGEILRQIKFPEKQLTPQQTDGEFVNIPLVNTRDEALREEIINAIFDAYEEHPKHPANNSWGKKD